MKFAGGFAVSIVSCLPLVIACGSAPSPNFFSERAGAGDPGTAAHAGSDEGGATSEDGGIGGTASSVAGHPSTGSGGKNSVAGRGGMSSDAGAASGGTTSTEAGTAGVSAGSGGKSNTSAGSGGTSAGASGSAGASAAGSGGNAGANAGSGGSASGSGGVSGGSGSAGSSGWSGWGGWSGWAGSSSGGAAGGSSCPSSPPTKGTVCDVTTPDSCFYAGQACSCLIASSGPGPGPIVPVKKWACYGDAGLCPDTKPVAGASCKNSLGDECPYPGNDYCVCSGSSESDAHWACQANPPTCAASKPLSDSCSTVRTCSWGTNKEQACFCNGSRWGCEGGF